MLRNKGLRGGRPSWENESADPLSGLANLSDVMLVLACGLMLAIVIFWRVDLSRITSIIDRDQLQEIENAEQIADSAAVGNGLESKGTAYMDPETGKVYIVISSEETEENEP